MRIAHNERRVVFPVGAAVLASLLVLSWWFFIKEDPRPSGLGYVSYSFRGYESIESITEVADAVVIGTVKGIIGREVQKLNNPAPGIIPSSHLEHPYVFYEVEVHETLKGTPGDTITLLRGDHTRVLNRDEKPLEAGQQVVLFLRSLTGDPGLPKFGDVKDLYGTLSFDHSVFEVFGETAIPRTPYFTDELDEDGKQPERFTLAEIRAKTGN